MKHTCIGGHDQWDMRIFHQTESLSSHGQLGALQAAHLSPEEGAPNIALEEVGLIQRPRGERCQAKKIKGRKDSYFVVSTIYLTIANEKQFGVYSKYLYHILVRCIA